MSIYEEVQARLTEARKARNKNDVNTYILIKGELDRVMVMMDGRKIVWDTEAVKVITKMKKGLDESEANGAATTVGYREILESFLPEQISESDVSEWMVANVNLGDYKNKMQAMKPIMSHFGPAVDGNMVKELLMRM